MNYSDRKKVDQKTGRAINRRLILNILRKEDGLSRSDLAERTGLSPAAVGFVVGDLLDERFVIEDRSFGEDGPKTGRNGRRPVPLRLNFSAHQAIGLKLGIDRIECILTDLGVNVVDQQSVAVESTEPEAVVQTAGRIVRRMLASRGKDRSILGVGASIPSRIDPNTGMCHRSHRFGWDEVPIGPMLSAELGLPVFVEDDTLAFGLAHQMFGLGQNHMNFAALAVGDGIGFVQIADGKVRRGTLGIAGKVGHVLHDPDGPVCECGRRGCLQASYSARSMERTWRERSDVALTVALGAGDPDARAFVEAGARAIAAHLAEWCTVADPELVVLGGEATAFGPAFVEPLRAGLDRGYYRMRAPKIVVDQSTYYWTAGPAAVAVQHVFDFEALPIGAAPHQAFRMIAS